MSEAFKSQWQRMSPNRRLLTMLTYLARRGDITIPINDLEAISSNPEGMSESFIGDNLILHHAPAGTQLYIIQDVNNIAQRRPQSWETQTLQGTQRIDQNPVQSHLDTLELGLNPQPEPAPRMTTLDDKAMAAAEQRQIRADELRKRAAEMRGHPLTVPQPPSAPQ